MKKITVTAVLFALCFATGFTCSKNAPQQSAQPTESGAGSTTTTTTTQEHMAAPAQTGTAGSTPGTATDSSAAGTTSGTATGSSGAAGSTTAQPAQPATPEAHK